MIIFKRASQFRLIDNNYATFIVDESPAENFFDKESKIMDAQFKRFEPIHFEFKNRFFYIRETSEDGVFHISDHITNSRCIAHNVHDYASSKLASLWFVKRKGEENSIYIFVNAQYLCKIILQYKFLDV